MLPNRCNYPTPGESSDLPIVSRWPLKMKWQVAVGILACRPAGASWFGWGSSIASGSRNVCSAGRLSHNACRTSRRGCPGASSARPATLTRHWATLEPYSPDTRPAVTLCRAEATARRGTISCARISRPARSQAPLRPKPGQPTGPTRRRTANWRLSRKVERRGSAIWTGKLKLCHRMALEPASSCRQTWPAQMT